MISAFGVDHAVSKALTPEQEARARKRARLAGRPSPNAYDRMAVGGQPSALVAKSKLGEKWVPITQIPRSSRRAMKNAIVARRAGIKNTPEQPLPQYWYHPGIGRVRVTRYNGNGLFEGVDSKDNIRVVHRRNATFGKAMPKTVPDSVSVMLPGSTVRAYDHSRHHKTEAGAKNFGSKLVGGGVGFAVGAAAGGRLARRLKPLSRATTLMGRSVERGGKYGAKVVKKPITITADVKRGWAQSMAGGALGGAAGTAAGNASLKRIRNNPRYGYRR